MKIIKTKTYTKEEQEQQRKKFLRTMGSMKYSPSSLSRNNKNPITDNKK